MGVLREEPYLTPAGCQDFPFAYILDATAFTDGGNLANVQVPISGDADFILRRIVGMDTVLDTAANGGKFSFKNASGSYANSAQFCRTPNYIVVPEKRYPRNSQIVVDLYKILRASVANAGSTIYNSYVAFVGVKRFVQGQGYLVQRTPYPYRERRYSYEYALTITQGHYTTGGGTQVTPPVRQSILLDNFDFELLQIGISANNATGGLATNDFQIMLWDPGMHQLSTLPFNQGFINAARLTPSTDSTYQGVMPVPSMVYPAGGAITFDITSQLPNASVPATYNLSFEGIWRIPC